MGRTKKKYARKRKSRRRLRKQRGGDKLKLIVKLTGGLGNRFFQIMAGYGFAEKYDMDVYISNNYTKWNHIPEDESIQQLLSLFPNIKLLDKSYNNSNIQVLDENTRPTNDVYIDHYFQDIKYFPKNLPELTLIEPNNNILKNVNKDKLFFIHIRLGDLYGDNDNYKLTPPYYKECIKRIKDVYPDAIFIILSQDINNAKKFVNDYLLNDLLNNEIIYDQSDNNRIDSLYYMSICKGGICCNSTFSWMGAYTIRYSKYIFMPKPWIKNDTSTGIYPSWATLIDGFNSSGGKRILQKGGNGNIICISYADKGYENSKKTLKESAINVGGINIVKQFTFDDIDPVFKEENKEILSMPRGGGYWIWKPYFILKELKEMNDNDILIYTDTAMNFISSIQPYIQNMTGSFMLFQHGFYSPERGFTKGDIFNHFNVLNNKDITDSTQLDASHSIWKKNDNSIKFVTEWLDLCKNKQFVTDAPSIIPNLNDFGENRHDQSLLSVLAKVKKNEYNIQIEVSATDYANNPEARNKNLPTLLHHHRNRN